MRKLLEKKLKNIVIKGSQSKKKTFDICIIGSKGLLGAQISGFLKSYKILKIARDNSDFNLDLKNYKKLKVLFKSYNFKYLINCAGVINLKYCERYFNKAKIINSDLANFLSQMSVKWNFKLVHISTDHFYKTKKNTLHKENEKIVSVNKYAKTKKLAEFYVKRNPNNLIIRTNFTGKKKSSNSTFVQWLYTSIIKNKTIGLFNDMYTSTLDVKYCAKIILKLMFNNSRGIYNVGSKDCLSKKDFAVLFAKKLNKNINFKEISCQKPGIIRGNNLGLNVKKTENKLKIKMINSKKVIDNLVKEFR